MRKGLTGKQMIFSALALVLVIGIIVGVITLLEQNENNRQRELLAQEAEKYSRSLWTDENTIQIEDETFGFDHRLETFLFVGTDLSGGEQVFESNKTRQPMADFLLLMVLDHTRNTIGYLQIDRNTITRVTALDEYGKSTGIGDMQICIAHWYGSTQEMAADNLMKAVRRYLGELENIDGYYVINMADIGRLNNAVGGVDITLDEDLTDADPAFVKGATVHLTDEQAERYLRARMNVSDGTNVSRMSRQRIYMNSLFAAVKQKCEEDSQFALTLWNTLRSAAFTNMNGNDFSRIAQKLMKGENLGIRTVEGETREGYKAGDGIPHEEFYPSRASLKAQLTELFSLIPVEEDEAATEGEDENADTRDAGDDDEDDEEEDESDEGADISPAIEDAPEIMDSGLPDDSVSEWIDEEEEEDEEPEAPGKPDETPRKEGVRTRHEQGLRKTGSEKTGQRC